MACNTSKLVVIEEMNSLLAFLENEISELEKEKNERKVKYHLRPPEERNIMKDILAMHTEFEIEIVKLKEITESFSKVPSNKNQMVDITEEKIEKLANMQVQFIEFHETIQRLQLKKADFCIENQKISEKLSLASDKISKYASLMEEIRSYGNKDIFFEKIKTLKNEISRLEELINTIDNKDGIQFDGIQTSDVPSLTESKAMSILNKIKHRNQTIEYEINKNSDILSTIEEEKQLKKLIEYKKTGNLRKKDVYNRLQVEIDDLIKFEEEQEDEHTKKMKILDKIIGIRPGYQKIPTRPKTSISNASFLDNIEISLNRAKAIKSPPLIK